MFAKQNIYVGSTAQRQFSGSQVFIRKVLS